MKVLIIGPDGYLGFPLAQRLLERGHEVVGIDNLSRRRRVREVGGWTAIPISDPYERVEAIKDRWPDFTMRITDVMDSDDVDYVFQKHRPDAVVHLGEIPSAPYSMIDQKHCIETFNNNVNGTLNILHSIAKYAPECHQVKLGTMGEWGTPDCDIPEGEFEIDFRGRRVKLPFPKRPGSFYHLTKAADSLNIRFACDSWDLGCTDIMQGVVHGTTIKEMEDDPRLRTRFDFDECWGTAINRFCAQAVIEHPLTPYGKGGQTRGYIALRDSIQCMTLIVENPPDEGEYRVLNQLDECYDVYGLALKVQEIAREFDLHPPIAKVKNPRIEAEEHYYNPDTAKLRALGFKPTLTLEDELRVTIPLLLEHKERIEAKRETIMPKTKWERPRAEDRDI